MPTLPVTLMVSMNAPDKARKNGSGSGMPASSSTFAKASATCPATTLVSTASALHIFRVGTSAKASTDKLSPGRNSPSKTLQAAVPISTPA